MGVMAVETANLKPCFQSNAPSAGFTETNPLCVKKIICRVPCRVAATGVEWVIFSSWDFQASAPVSLLKATKDCPAPPPAT